MLTREIEGKFNSGEYDVKLSETLTSIIKGLKNANSEATVASIFENNLHHFLKDYFNHEIVFYKETTEKYLRHKFEGRIDAISNGLIIEYKDIDKLNKENDKDKALNQIKNYLIQIYNETGNSYQGLLTNGTKVSYLYFIGEEVYNTPFKSIDTKDLDRIVRSLLEVGTKQFDPKNIVSDFKLNSTSDITYNLSQSLYKAINSNPIPKTKMLIDEWQVLFRLSESDKGQNQDIEKRRQKLSEIFNDKIDTNEKEYVALFVLQTTYAIVVKLMACKVISNISFSEDIKFFSDLSIISPDLLQSFMEKLEDGYVFASGGIRNLLEGDFYSWYSDKNQWNDEIYLSIISIIEELENYSSSNFTYEFSTIDIFKDLYMEIMPNEVRHSLGEYFTPSWLADNVVRKTICKLNETKQNSWRAIDPCCGSGIFVISLIKSIINGHDLYSLTAKEKNDLLYEILDRVSGIDLNPLSVLTARISYFLAIRPLIDDQKIEIPIYLGDSADVPQKILIDNVECYHYEITTRQGVFDVDLPCSFVEDKSFFEVMYRLQTTVKAEDVDILYNQIITYIDSDSLNKEIEESILNLSNKLVELHINEWDGIWIRIISNFMLIARIKNIDIIVGNPPWVKWEFLPQNYAEKIKKLCIDKQLFSGQTYMGAISLNLCALIANVTVDNWLSDDGVLSFLMPQTIMTQDSYAGFRNFYLSNNERMYLQEVDDWTKSGNPFIVTTEKFLTYFYKKNEVDYSNGIPINYYSKIRGISVKEINRYHTYEKVEQYFDIKEGMAYQLNSERTGFTMIPERDFDTLHLFRIISGKSDYKARSGVEFTPAEVYFIEPTGKPINNNLTHFFRNSEFNNSVYKNDSRYKIELETKYIRPVIKSPNIKPFNILDSNNYCIFPYVDGSKKSIEMSELIKENPLLVNYLISKKNLIGRQSKRSQMIAMGKDFYSLSKVGTYTYAPNKVVFRDNTKMQASVLSKINTPWGEEVMPIPAKHCPYISMDNAGNEITEDEAYYLCGILNTPIIGKYFSYTFSGRSYSIDFKIKLPKYDDSNSIHVEIMNLARNAENNLDDLEEIVGKIEYLYIKICDN